MPEAASKSAVNAPSERTLTQMLDQLTRMIHAQQHAEGLYPAQWVALRYFAEAPEPQRTTTQLARFQGIEHGPVSRTVSTLVTKGLLKRRQSSTDRRSHFLDVTPAGLSLLGQDPLRCVDVSLAALSGEAQHHFGATLQALTEKLQAQGR